ncbi:MAG: O-antigen ligase family protein [Microgenomates group bacterium]
MESYRKLKFFYFLTFFLILNYLITSFRFNLTENLIAFFYLARIIIYFLYGIFLSYWTKKNKHNFNLSSLILKLSLLVIFFSLAQYLLYPDLRNLRYLGWDEHLYRMFGLFFDTSVAGAIYGLFFLYFYYLKKINNKFQLVFLFLFLTAIVLTFSRLTYIGILITTLIDLSLRKKIKFIFLFLLTFALILILAPKPFGEGVNLKRQFSIISRLNDYRAAFNIWKKYPIFGIGYNRIGFYKPIDGLFPSHSNFSFSSSYLIILVCGGIVGFFLFLSGLLKLFFQEKNSRIYLFFIYFLSFFDNIILHPFVIFLLILFLINNS